MKLTTIVTGLSALALAAPVAEWETPCPQGCYLRIESNNTGLNGTALSLDGATNSLFQSSAEDGYLIDTPTPELQYGYATFWAEPSLPKNITLSLHGHNEWQHNLGLQEKIPGFLALVDMWAPWEQMPDASTKTGNKTEWGVFTIDPQTRVFGVKDESDIPTRQWIMTTFDAADGASWFGLWDGKLISQR